MCSVTSAGSPPSWRSTLRRTQVSASIDAAIATPKITSSVTCARDSDWLSSAASVEACLRCTSINSAKALLAAPPAGVSRPLRIWAASSVLPASIKRKNSSRASTYFPNASRTSVSFGAFAFAQLGLRVRLKGGGRNRRAAFGLSATIFGLGGRVTGGEVICHTPAQRPDRALGLGERSGAERGLFFGGQRIGGNRTHAPRHRCRQQQHERNQCAHAVQALGQTE